VYDICREFPGEEIHIKSTDQLWIHVTSGVSQLKLPSIDVGLYPQANLENLPEKVITTAEDLKYFIEATLFAAQTNESRRNLMGVCLSIIDEKTTRWLATNESRRNLMGVCLSIIDEKTTRWLATDGHRLAQFIGSVPSTVSENVFEVIIPRKALQEVSKAADLFIDPVEVSFDDRTLQFFSSCFTIQTRLIEGKFPNCDPIIPKDNDFSIVVDRERLMSSLRIVSLISNEKLKPVKVTISPEKLILESEKAEYGEVRDEIVINHSGEEFQIGFNARYLLDVLHVLHGEEILLEFKNAMSPCLIKDPTDDSFLSVIMPLRIEW
jgi:DNA polymerase-3 subunit beta